MQSAENVDLQEGNSDDETESDDDDNESTCGLGQCVLNIFSWIVALLIISLPFSIVYVPWDYVSAYFNTDNYIDGDTYVVRTKYEVWGHSHIFHSEFCM